MSVLLGILAIIGKILLVILCVILVLLALVLFVPVRYAADADGNGDSGTWHLDAKVSWLLHLISFEFLFHKGDPEKTDGTETIFRIFGISPKALKKRRAEKKKKKKKEKKKEELKAIREEDPDEYERLKEEAAARKKAREERRARAAAEEEERRKAEEEERARTERRAERLKLYAKQKMGRTRRAILAAKETVADVFFLLVTGFAYLADLPAILAGKLFDLAGALWRFWIRAADLTDFLWDGRTHAGIRKVKSVLKSLVRHILPKKMSGDVVFGTEDPGTTGRILAALSVIYPLYGGKVNLSPDFQEKRFDGTLHLEGRVFLFYVVYLALGLIADRNVRYMYKFYKKIRNSSKEENVVEDPETEDSASGSSGSEELKEAAS